MGSARALPMLVVLTLAAGTPAAAQDAAAAGPLPGALAYAAALEAGDPAGVAAALGDDAFLADPFCCTGKGAYLAVLASGWAAGTRHRVTDVRAAGEPVSFRQHTESAADRERRVPPAEAEYTVMVRGGRPGHAGADLRVSGDLGRGGAGFPGGGPLDRAPALVPAQAAR